MAKDAGKGGKPMRGVAVGGRIGKTTAAVAVKAKGGTDRQKGGKGKAAPRGY
jgi:hypothetical protein